MEGINQLRYMQEEKKPKSDTNLFNHLFIYFIYLFIYFIYLFIYLFIWLLTLISRLTFHLSYLRALVKGGVGEECVRESVETKFVVKN